MQRFVKNCLFRIKVTSDSENNLFTTIYAMFWILKKPFPKRTFFNNFSNCSILYLISVYQKFQHFVLSNFGRILHAQIKNFPLAVIFKSPALPPTCSSKESQTFPVAGKLAALLRVTKAAVPGSRYTSKYLCCRIFSKEFPAMLEIVL